MSYNKNDEEVNYWPSVSDMFLVFFIIALCIVAGMFKSFSNGEKKVIDEVIYQSNVLFKNVDIEESYNKDQEQDESRPQLAHLLMQASEKIKTNNMVSCNELPPDENFGKAKTNYRDAVLHLIKLDGTDEEISMSTTRDSARILDEVNQKLNGKSLLQRATDAENAVDNATKVDATQKRSKDYAELIVLDEVIYQSNKLFELLKVKNEFGNVLRYDKKGEQSEYRPHLAQMLMRAEQSLYSIKTSNNARNSRYRRYANASMRHKAFSDYRKAIDYLYRGVTTDAEYEQSVTLDSSRKLSVVHAKITSFSLLDVSVSNDSFVSDNDGKRPDEAVAALLSKISALNNENQKLNDENQKMHIIRKLDEQKIQNLLKSLSNLKFELNDLKENSRISNVVLNGRDLQFYTNSVAILKFPKRNDSELMAQYDALAENLKAPEGKAKRKVIEIIGHTDLTPSSTDFAQFFYNLSADEEKIQGMGEFDRVNLPSLDARREKAMEIWNSLRFSSQNVGTGNAALGLARARRFEEEIKSEIIKRIAGNAKAMERFNDGYIKFRCYSAAQLYPSSASSLEENRRIELLVRNATDETE